MRRGADFVTPTQNSHTYAHAHLHILVEKTNITIKLLVNIAKYCPKAKNICNKINWHIDVATAAGAAATLLPVCLGSLMIVLCAAYCHALA